jgi:HEAT repeat protein
VEPICERLKDNFDRDHAKRALAEWGGSAPERAVLKLIDHSDRRVRIAVCEILKAIGTQESVPALEQIIRSKDRFLSRPAAEALKAIKSRGGK